MGAIQSIWVLHWDGFSKYAELCCIFALSDEIYSRLTVYLPILDGYAAQILYISPKERDIQWNAVE
jgi:hypothetical protein